MFRVGIVTIKGRIEAETYNTREEVDNYILRLDEQEEVIRYRIEENGILIETEQGKRWRNIIANVGKKFGMEV